MKKFAFPLTIGAALFVVSPAVHGEFVIPRIIASMRAAL